MISEGCDIEDWSNDVENRGVIYKVCVRSDLILEPIFIKTVFDVEKCLASRQCLSRCMHFLLSEYCSFF